MVGGSKIPHEGTCQSKPTDSLRRELKDFLCCFATKNQRPARANQFTRHFLLYFCLKWDSVTDNFSPPLALFCVPLRLFFCFKNMTPTLESTKRIKRFARLSGRISPLCSSLPDVGLQPLQFETISRIVRVLSFHPSELLGYIAD